MQVKTITTHDIYNFGASLQAYALMSYLEKLGHEVEIINYKPVYLNLDFKQKKMTGNQSGKISGFLNTLLIAPFKYASFQSRKAGFDKFTRKYLRLTEKIYRSNDELKSDVPVADLYIAGSGEIWNSMFPEGKDPAFYLDFVPKTQLKASYAASFAINYIEKGYEEKIRLWLENLDYISVREETGRLITQSLGLNTVKVLDPVFLISAYEWQKFADKNRIKEKYILVFDPDNNFIIESLVKRISKRSGYPVVAIKGSSTLKYAHKTVKNPDPLDFIDLIANCEYFISNSYHGTAFAIIFNKEFYAFNKLKHKINSRLTDLLVPLGLKNRLISDNPYIDISNKLNYSRINHLLNEKILLSKDYLHHIISKKNNLRGLLR